MEIFYNNKKYKVEISKYLKGNNPYLGIEAINGDSLIPIATNPKQFPSLIPYVGPKRVFIPQEILEKNPGLVDILIAAGIIGSTPVLVQESINLRTQGREVICIYDIL